VNHIVKIFKNKNYPFDQSWFCPDVRCVWRDGGLELIQVNQDNQEKHVINTVNRRQLLIPLIKYNYLCWLVELLGINLVYPRFLSSVIGQLLPASGTSAPASRLLPEPVVARARYIVTEKW